MRRNYFALLLTVVSVACLTVSCSEDNNKKEECLTHCDGNTLIACVDGVPYSMDCTQIKATCGYDDENGYSCTSSVECHNMGCNGDVLTTCGVDGEVVTDCAALGKKCDEATWSCVSKQEEPPACEAGCKEGVMTTCGADGAKTEKCQEGYACDDEGKKCVEVKKTDCTLNGTKVENGSYVCDQDARKLCVEGELKDAACDVATPICDVSAENACRAYKSCSVGSLTVSHEATACAEDDRIVVRCDDGALSTVKNCSSKQQCQALDDGNDCVDIPCTDETRETLCASLIEGKTGMVTYCDGTACAAKCDEEGNFVEDKAGACVCSSADNYIPGEGAALGTCVLLECDDPYSPVDATCVLDEGTCVAGDTPDVSFCGEKGSDWGWTCAETDAVTHLGTCEKACLDTEHYDLVDDAEGTRCTLKAGMCKKNADCPAIDLVKNWEYTCGEMVSGFGKCVETCNDKSLFYNADLNECILCDPAENDATTGYNAKCDNGTYHTLPTCTEDRQCQVDCVAPYEHTIPGSTSCSLTEFKCLTADDCRNVTNVSEWACESIDEMTGLGDCVGTCSKYLWQADSHVCGCADGFYKDSSNAEYGVGTENNGCVPNCTEHICSVDLDTGDILLRECRFDPTDTNYGKHKAAVTCEAPINGSVDCDVQKGCVVSCNDGYDFNEETSTCDSKVSESAWTLITTTVPDNYTMCVATDSKTTPCDCSGNYFDGLTKTGSGNCSKLNPSSSPITAPSSGTAVVNVSGYNQFNGNIYQKLDAANLANADKSRMTILTLSASELEALAQKTHVMAKFKFGAKSAQHQNIGVVFMNDGVVFGSYGIANQCPSDKLCSPDDTTNNVQTAAIALPETIGSISVGVFTYGTVDSTSQELHIYPISVWATKVEAETPETGSTDTPETGSTDTPETGSTDTPETGSAE